MLSKTLPYCSFSFLQNGKELDGIGYIRADSGHAGVESLEDGVVSLKWRGSSWETTPVTPQNTATNYIVAEAFMGVSNCSQQTTQSDYDNEKNKAIDKLVQLGESLDYLKSRYADQKIRGNIADTPDENYVNGAAFLVTYCYSDDDETNGTKSDRSKKLTRLRIALEDKLDKIWQEKLLNEASSGTRDPRLDELFRLAMQNRLSLAVLSNREACRTSTAINMAKKFDKMDTKQDESQEEIKEMKKKQDSIDIKLNCIIFFFFSCFFCFFLWHLYQTYLNKST